jgi:hypothetical protein
VEPVSPFGGERQLGPVPCHKTRQWLMPPPPVDEDWYPGYHPTWTQKAQGGVRYEWAHHPKDFRGPWRASQGIDNYIYQNICKIGKKR